MDPVAITLLWGAVAFLVIALGGVAMFARFYRKVDQGRALIINPFSGSPKVTFTGGLVVPIVARGEEMEISVKTIELDRRGKEGLICKDNIRADISVTFFVQVNKTQEDVLKVAQLLGSKRASDQATIEELFVAKFAEALKTVGKQFDFAELYQQRNAFRQAIVQVIGDDLNGFELEDVAIDYLEQTPIELLDRENILDAQGIRKITEITAEQSVFTNELRQKQRMEIGAQNLQADEAIFQFEQRRAEAEARKDKQVASTQAREQNEAERVRDHETKTTAMAKIRHQEEVAVAIETKERGVAVAQKNREREIAVETERVEKARALEEIGRERETELGRIAKDQELEQKRKEIADVVRTRVAVDKTVAEEEERIKDLRALAEAKRHKETSVITAEAAAEEALIKQVKAAEAREAEAKLEAQQLLTLANAELEIADKKAQGQLRLAEGAKAEASAEGLAAVQVREANAQALRHEGLAEAEVSREKLRALATGEEERGLAEARVRQEQAAAEERQGLAEAVTIERKLSAEATGLAEKAKAMQALDGVGREHEEFRLQLEKQKDVELARIAAQKDIASAQATVMAEAMGNANINIVGGDGAFFDRFVNAVSLGKSLDGALDHSDSLRTLLSDYLEGEGSLPGDLKEVLSRPALTAGAVRDLSIGAALTKFIANADGATRTKLQQLLAHAKELGLDS
ncbi:MAG: hypothetical protein AAGE52_27865 [Myxococcota bacterium]